MDAACVMMAGPMKTAAAPWKPILVWQTIRCCVTVEGFATAEHVNVTHHMQARPVRSAPFVRAHVRSIQSAWSVGRSEQEQRSNGENRLLLMQGVGVQWIQTLQQH